MTSAAMKGHGLLEGKVVVVTAAAGTGIGGAAARRCLEEGDRKSTRLNSSHSQISDPVFCLKKKGLLTGAMGGVIVCQSLVRLGVAFGVGKRPCRLVFLVNGGIGSPVHLMRALLRVPDLVVRASRVFNEAAAPHGVRSE